jgi:uncharacterized protein YjbI with pentapeptide repeats
MTDATEPPNKIGEAPGDATPVVPAPGTAGFAAKAKDLQALRDAVVDAASVGAGLWVSFLFVFFYLAIAAGGVTHRDLFLENPVKLPFLNVDLPLIGFFVLGPLLFLIVHAYTLLHFVLLAGKVGAFHAELQQQIPDEDVGARLRRQLPSNIFVQFLAGPREIRAGAMGFMLRLIAQITLVAGPLALLVFFQLQFLPYHHEAISWWQRLSVVADLVLLWVLWPSVARGTTTSLGWRDFRSGKAAAYLLASVLPVLLVFTVATFPGEWLEDSLPTLRFVPTAWGPLEWASPHELLVAGEVDLVAQRPRSLWSNRLALPGIDVIDHAKLDSEAKIAALPMTVSLRGRRLEGAVLLDAHLRKADFTGARLNGALLALADLRETKFDCAATGSKAEGSEQQCSDLRGALLPWAQLQGASLNGAQLQGALLDRAQLQGARLDGAQLQRASLFVARLHGASLDGAQLQGAWLDLAGLQGASLAGAQLQGASLGLARLQGASLAGAQLQGALLRYAQLQGASLDLAQLQGASLDQAELQGASLDNAEVQGASFCEAQLQGALLYHVSVWRADARKMKAEGALIIGPNAAPMSADTFVALQRLIEIKVPQGDLREKASARIERLNPKEILAPQPDPWLDLEQSSPLPEDYYKILAEILQKTGCDADGTPHVIHGLLRTLDRRFTSDHSKAADLAAAFLDEASCPGARGLSDKDKSELQKISGVRPASAKP